jgi:hypothetical protein
MVGGNRSGALVGADATPNHVPSCSGLPAVRTASREACEHPWTSCKTDPRLLCCLCSSSWFCNRKRYKSFISMSSCSGAFCVWSVNYLFFELQDPVRIVRCGIFLFAKHLYNEFEIYLEFSQSDLCSSFFYSQSPGQSHPIFIQA